jgi:arylformamidase
MNSKLDRTLVVMSLVLASTAVHLDGHPRGRLADGRRGRGTPGARESRRAEVPLPAGVLLERDLAYGSHALQRFDVYYPEHVPSAPVIFMVHGGAWRFGDKGMSAVFENKVARWVPQGLVFISVNYRLLPEADALAQVDDVAQALVRAQEEAARFGGDRSRFVLMGHSAGAHLVALLAADPERALRLGATPWLGTVSLDSGAMNVVEIMQAPHSSMYDQAFGSDPRRWRAASPFHQLHSAVAPFLAVCSSRREDSCDQARAFSARAVRLGTRARVLPVDLSHREVNELLGKDPGYTAEVESFLVGLDPSFRRARAHPRPSHPGTPSV